MTSVIRSGKFHGRVTGGVVQRRQGGAGRKGKSKVVQGSQTSATLAKLREPEPKTLAELASKMRQDYQVALAERVMTANVQSSPVDISIRYRDGGTDKKRAELLRDSLIGLWKHTLKKMMRFLGDGRVAFEKVWDYNKEARLTFIRKLEDLPFKVTEMLLFDKTDRVPEEMIGAFKGIRLRGGEDEMELPPSKSWWLALDATSVEPHGHSRFLGAPYKTWLDRQELKRFRSLFIQRFCLGGGVAHIPEQVVNEEGEIIDVFEATAEAYDELAAGGIMLLPNDREQGPNGPGDYIYDFDAVGLEVRDGSPLISMVEAMDSEQLLAFGIPPKTVIEGDAVGSFALVSQQMLILFSVIEDLLDQLTDSFQTYIIDKSVETNYEPHEAPKLSMTYKKLTERPDDLAVELVKNWLTTPQLSPFVTSGAVNITSILDMVGIPVSEDAEQRIQKLLETAQGLQAENPEGGSGGPSPVPPAAPEAAEEGGPVDPDAEASMMDALTVGGGGSGQNGKPKNGSPRPGRDFTMANRNGHGVVDLDLPFPLRLR